MLREHMLKLLLPFGGLGGYLLLLNLHPAVDGQGFQRGFGLGGSLGACGRLLGSKGGCLEGIKVGVVGGVSIRRVCTVLAVVVSGDLPVRELLYKILVDALKI